MPHTNEAHRDAVLALERMQQLLAEMEALNTTVQAYDESSPGRVTGVLATLRIEIPEALQALRRNTPAALRIQRQTYLQQSKDRAYERLADANRRLERARSPAARAEASKDIERCREAFSKYSDALRELDAKPT